MVQHLFETKAKTIVFVYSVDRKLLVSNEPAILVLSLIRWNFEKLV